MHMFDTENHVQNRIVVYSHYICTITSLWNEPRSEIFWKTQNRQKRNLALFMLCYEKYIEIFYLHLSFAATIRKSLGTKCNDRIKIDSTRMSEGITIVRGKVRLIVQVKSRNFIVKLLHRIYSQKLGHRKSTHMHWNSCQKYSFEYELVLVFSSFRTS